MCQTMFPAGIIFIVLVEFCERLCYYTFAGTQKTWLQDRGYSNSQSSSINLIWAEVCYVCCFVGGWLASTRVGIFRTIAILSLAYAIGTYLSAVAALPNVNSVPFYLVGTFGLVALGSGGIKPNVCTMGANQFDPADPDAEEKRASFFLYFYLTINVGSAISHAFLSSWATSGVPSIGVEIEYGYFFAWMVAASFMFLAFLVFVAGYRSYRKLPPAADEEPVVRLFVQALKQGSSFASGKLAILGWALIPLFILVSIVNAFAESPTLKIVSAVVAVVCIGSLVIAHLNNKAFLPKGDVSDCLDCVPLLLVGNLFFGILQSTIASVFQSQACQMDTRRDGSDFSYEGFQYSGDFFRLANPVTIVIGTPLLDRVIYPFIRQVIGKEVSIGCKVVSGFSFAICAQIVAASIEYARKGAAVLPVPSHCAPKVDGEHVHMSDINSFYMVAPYAMVGIGEIMVNPVLQHLAYEGAPSSMKSLLQAFNLFAMGALPNGVASIISQALKQQVPNDLNKGDLPLVYFINSGIGLLGIVSFFAVFYLSPERFRHGRTEKGVCTLESDSETEVSSEEG
ncbi:NPF8.1 [Symbiodinium sp. CCMP2592]|nr:NPF8.1 [Symbiodinium sp. CCMP2592]